MPEGQISLKKARLRVLFSVMGVALDRYFPGRNAMLADDAM
jgi:hypothetical protein